MNKADPVIVAAPAIGPAVVTLFGEQIPLMALSLSLAGLVLARMVAPQPRVATTRARGVALTVLLCVIDFAAVITLQPGAGMAVAAGVGLGFSGMLAVQFFGDRIRDILQAAFGRASSKE
ncbi:hypothetical protein [Sphingomonas sanxanigenens]|uniref:Uncharacterized protein n=1 Tax=Sphingomonas sanxanigenens DSM 19645 = NX02 TaxID=1123269 RepID=W0AM76_9SPHN|nr:hypothetical protein [Sphingomonas sanxanigenens]AHE55549.1 hypothetical protein NX02_19445 [Sphingomonas sanxanigenens DSM 19645 = NX02]AHE57443.1 hypothetical protein NX02_29395 [Sphingomonas sanxanigenens DSM 19645 = NX02]